MELIAHRGASRERRENTLPAFERAIELGADGIELDTHSTSDGVVIVHHDEIPRAETSNPRLAGQPFAALTAEQVATFRFPDGAGIPTLAETIDLVGDRAMLYIELKARAIEHLVLESLRSRPVRFALHSFDHTSVKRVRASGADTVRTGVLTSSYVLEPERLMEQAGATDYWQSQDLVDEVLVERIHAAGGRLIVWTVNRPEQAAALAAMGVDGVCTDDLRAVGRAIARTT